MNKLRIVRKLLRLARVMVSNERVRCVFTQSELVQIRESLFNYEKGSVVYRKVDSYLGNKDVAELVLRSKTRCVFTQSELVQIREELISDGMDGSVVYKKVDAYLDGKTVFELGLRE